MTTERQVDVIEGVSFHNSMKEHLRMKTEYNCLKQAEKDNNVSNERPMKLGLTFKFFPFGSVPTYIYIFYKEC